MSVSQSPKDVETVVIEFSFSEKGISVWTSIWVPHTCFTVNFKDANCNCNCVVGGLVCGAFAVGHASL